MDLPYTMHSRSPYFFQSACLDDGCEHKVESVGTGGVFGDRARAVGKKKKETNCF